MSLSVSKYIIVLPVVITVFAGGLFSVNHVFAAETVKTLQTKIEVRNGQIKSLQDEIASYQKQLNVLGTKKSTLKSTLRALLLSRNKLTAGLLLTQKNVANTNSKLNSLSDKIKTTQSVIDSNKNTIASSLRAINQNDSTPYFARILAADGLTGAWIAEDQLTQLNQELGKSVKELSKAKDDLSLSRKKVSTTMTKLVSLKRSLVTKRVSIDLNTKSHKTLLYQTNNKESLYRKLITRKKAAEIAFERELSDLQSQLKLIVHPGLLPDVGKGVLAWPFSSRYMENCTKRTKVFGNIYCITQYFGNTPFATKNAQVYSGHGHNGIDIAAPIGTPLRAALSGTVLDTGDTDLSHDSRGRQCWSFGRWIMIAHSNGLNTMYSHLSKRYVTKGQKVKTGQIIGYSGMSGYATGPHLHFGVYAAEGTKIMSFGQFKGISGGRCSNAKMPVATIKAYLNPLSYLIQSRQSSHSFTKYK